MPASHTLQKALLLLDKGDAQRGEAELRKAREQGEAERDLVTLVTASCALGELLLELGRNDEARELFSQVLAHAGEPQFEYEVRRARELLTAR